LLLADKTLTPIQRSATSAKKNSPTMRSFLAGLIAFFTCATLCAAIAPTESDGYKLAEMQWEFAPFPSDPAHTVILNGTIEQAIAQVLRINPNFHSDFHLTRLEDMQPDAFKDVLDTLAAKFLDDDDPGEVDRWWCAESKTEWHLANRDNISKAISYIYQLAQGGKTKPHLGPGPGECTRVSCYHWDAIHWCNDVSTTSINLPKPTMQYTHNLDKMSEGLRLIFFV